MTCKVYSATAKSSMFHQKVVTEIDGINSVGERSRGRCGRAMPTFLHLWSSQSLHTEEAFAMSLVGTSLSASEWTSYYLVTLSSFTTDPFFSAASMNKWGQLPWYVTLYSWTHPTSALEFLFCRDLMRGFKKNLGRVCLSTLHIGYVPHTMHQLQALVQWF